VNLRRFLQDYTKFGVTIVEWSTFNANVLDFRYIFALSNYGANCLRLGMKNGANFGVFGPVRFRGHFEEIGIAKVNAICLRHFLVNCGILADRFLAYTYAEITFLRYLRHFSADFENNGTVEICEFFCIGWAM